MKNKEIQEMISLMRNVASQEVLPRFGNVKALTKINHRNIKESVTEADIKAGEKLLEVVRAKYPGSYSEEQMHRDRFFFDKIWQFDPIDGTNEFVAGMIDGYAMHAAFLEKEEEYIYFPSVGILYLPGVNKLWHNDEDGQLHFVNKGFEEEIPSQNRKDIRGYIRKIHPNLKVKNFYKNLQEKLGLESKFIYSGGAGASISNLLEGKINLIAFNYPYSKEWDLAMAEPLIKSQGGFICDFQGNEFQYNRGNPGNDLGYLISIAFSKDEIMEHVDLSLLDKKDEK